MEFNYQSNSNKSKNEREKKKIEKIVTGEVKTKKKTGVKKLSDVFISEDIGNVKSYILMDVLVPAIKKAVSDIVTNGIDMILYGESGRSKRSSSIGNVSYTKYYDRKDDRRDEPVRIRSGIDIDDIVLETRGEAEYVITTMQGIIETYGSVSIADLYDLLGKQSTPQQNKYGWMNVHNAEAIHVREGYLLRLPKVCPID